MTRALVVWLLGVTACYAPAPAEGLACPDGVCPSGQGCGVDGVCRAHDASVGACACTQDTLRCAGQPDTACPLGCAADGDRCGVLSPSGPARRADVEPATFVDGLSGSVLVDGDTGEILADGNIVRPAGVGLAGGITFRQVTASGDVPPVAIFGFRELRIDAAAEIELVGAHAIVLVAASIDVAGRIVARGGAQRRAPIGGAPARAGASAACAA
ncbi:MAG: hypothetical protein R2939_10135 [Kofleriaceae bacterium]